MEKRKFSFIIVMSTCMAITISSCNTNTKNKNIVRNVQVKPVKIESPELTELNTHFTYNGNAINPFIIQKLLSNGGPDVSVTCCVDLIDASKSTEFVSYGRNTIEIFNEGGFVKGKKYEYSYDNETPSYSIYSYKWYGKLNNGVHVLKIVEDTGGSATFIDLLYVRFSIQYINVNGKKQKQLLMSNVGYYKLGDRVETNIKLDSIRNKLIVKNKQNDYSSDTTTYVVKF